MLNWGVTELKLAIRLLLLLVVCLVPATPASAFSFVVEEEDGSLTNLTRFRPPAFLREHSEYAVTRIEYGNATYYHPSLHGGTMANGEPYSRFDPIIAASPFFPLGTIVRVTRLSTGAANRRDHQGQGSFPWLHVDRPQRSGVHSIVTVRNRPLRRATGNTEPVTPSRSLSLLAVQL